MLSLSNSITLLRAPLALLFLLDHIGLRLGVIFLAMMTDSIDGYLARRRRTTSRFGAILDPVMDKFFVMFVLGVLLSEHKLAPWQACAMISRDFSLLAFGLYLSISGLWQGYEFRAIRWGKIATALQFFVLIALTLGMHFPGLFYLVFVLFGLLAFNELWSMKKAAQH